MSAKREPCASDDAFADEDLRAPNIRTSSNLLTEIEIYFQLSYTAFRSLSVLPVRASPREIDHDA